MSWSKRCGKQIFAVRLSQQSSQRSGKEASSQRVLPQALQVEGAALGVGHQAENGAPQREVLNRANSDQRDGQLDTRNLSGKAEIGRVDELQHLAGQARVRFDRDGELGGPVLRVLRELKQSNGALRQGRQLGTCQQGFDTKRSLLIRHFLFTLVQSPRPRGMPRKQVLVILGPLPEPGSQLSVRTGLVAQPTDNSPLRSLHAGSDATCCHPELQAQLFV